MDCGPDTSGLRQPPQPHQQPEAPDFRREVPDVSLVFNPDERSLVLPSLPPGRDRLQQNLHRSRSVPGRISDPAQPPPPSPHYRTPPPRPSSVAVPPRPSPLTRPAGARLADVSISYEDGREVRRAAVSGAPPSVAERSCCGAELRAVLRLVADNGRQLAELRAQLRQLASRGAAPPGRRVLLRDAQIQTEGGAARPATAAAGVNTSCSLSARSRRDVGTDPAPPPPPPPPPAGRPSEVTASGGRENTAQLQQRRVQEWVAGAGWGTRDELEPEPEPEPELTLRGVLLPPVAEQPPSPEASLHVDMHEYQPSKDGSTDGSVPEEDADLERAKPDRTFFQNVMGQVNQILDGAGCGEPDVRQTRPEQPTEHRSPPQHESDPVRRATLQQLRAAGVSFAPSQHDDGSVLDYSCVPRAAMQPSAAALCSSDLSLEMNTLAMKYVDPRQMLQRAAAVGGRPAPHPVEARLLGKENLAPTRGRPTDMTMYGISDSNMSFSTRKYMEKFNLQS